MKKNTVKTLLALLLTLCLLSGGVAALADEIGAPAFVDDVESDDVVAGDIPAPVDTTVTVVPGETAGEVTVTVSDISSTGANIGLDVNAETTSDDNGKVIAEKDTLEINGSDKLLTDEQKKLIEGANDLTVEAGVVAENISKPVEVKTPRVDDDGNPVLDENGNQVFDVSYNDSVTALTISTDSESAKETINVTTGDLYAKTTAATEGDDYSSAEGFNIYNNGKGDAVTLKVGGTVYTDNERPDTKVEYNEASAYGPYISTSNGATTDVYMDDSLTTSSAQGKNAEAYAYGVSMYTGDEGAKTDAMMDDVVATATATGEKSEAYTRGLNVSDSEGGTSLVIADSVTATAAAAEDATARGVVVYAAEGGSADVTVIDPVNATATVTNPDGTELQSTAKDVDAQAVGLTVYTTNGKAQVAVYDDVSATSNGDATAIKVNPYSSDTVWDAKTEKDVQNTTPGLADVDVVGNVIAEGTQDVIGVDINAETGSTYDKNTEKSEKDKQGGRADVTIDGNVFAQGAETHASTDDIIAANVCVDTNATANLTVTGDVTATGKDAVGLDVTTEKGATANVLVEGTVYGDGVAIAVENSSTLVEVDAKGEVTNKDDKPEVYDPTAANIYVWAATENADGRIATVYDFVTTRTEHEVTKTNADGTQYVDTEYTEEGKTTVDEAASAKLEQAIWYIVGVDSKWQKRVTATGTGTYTANDNTYQVAHQDDNVTLAIKLSSGKKLKKIMYNDGTEAEYVKNEDGTYTVKMKRGGAMELSLKVKKKYKPAATTEAAEAETATAEATAEAQPTEDALVKLDEAEGENATITILGIEEVLNGEEMERFNKLPVKDRLTVALNALGFAEDMGELKDGLSGDAKALSDDIIARIGNMSEEEKQALLDAIAERFPKQDVTVDGKTYEGFSIDVQTDRDGETSKDRYTFYNKDGAWTLYGVEEGV